MKPIHLNSLYKFSTYIPARSYDFLKNALQQNFGDHLAFGHSDGSMTVLHNMGGLAERIDLISGGIHDSDSLAVKVGQLDHRMEMRLAGIIRRLDRLDSRPINCSSASTRSSASYEPHQPTPEIIAFYAGGQA
ncbi:hypothetical protein [Sphingobium yanoikuyae]|jgi:hypothetical protein|uniref:hypothetical protein n=1 Tax=Sphingobium yanoikuyae TaxID=13690 RepID=UPI0035C80FD5